MALKRLCHQPRVLVSLSVVTALLAALLYLQLATPIYVSTARLLIEPPGIERLDPNSSVDFIPTYGAGFFPTQTAIVQSHQIIEHALADPNMSTLTGSADPKYIEHLVSTLTASVEAGTDIMNVTASSPHPEDAARFVNAVVKAYTQWMYAPDTTESIRSVLQRGLEECQGQLDDAREKVQLLSQESPSEVTDVEVSPEVQKEYEALLRECRRLEDGHRALAQRIKRFQVPVPRQLKVHVLEYAVAAGKPAKPNKARVLGVAVGVGLLVGALLAATASAAARRAQATIDHACDRASEAVIHS